MTTNNEHAKYLARMVATVEQNVALTKAGRETVKAFTEDVGTHFGAIQKAEQAITLEFVALGSVLRSAKAFLVALPTNKAEQRGGGTAFSDWTQAMGLTSDYVTRAISAIDWHETIVSVGTRRKNAPDVPMSYEMAKALTQYRNALPKPDGQRDDRTNQAARFALDLASGKIKAEDGTPLPLSATAVKRIARATKQTPNRSGGVRNVNIPDILSAVTRLTTADVLGWILQPGEKIAEPGPIDPDRAASLKAATHTLIAICDSVGLSLEQEGTEVTQAA